MDTDDTTAAGLSRRAFLGTGAAGTLGLALAGSLGPIARASGAEHGPAKPAAGFDGYGPLRPDPAGRLSLPKGFHYTVVAESGVTRLETGQPSPDYYDGTASFVRRGGDGSVLVANHEIREPGSFIARRAAGPGVRLRPRCQRRDDDHRGRQARPPGA